MDAEIIPFPERRQPFVVPEMLSERLRLADTIDEQVALWQSRSRSPAMRRRSLAAFIAEDCQPLGREPKNYLPEATFGGSMSREEALFRTEYEKRRAELSKWTTKESIDEVAAHNEPYEEFIQQVASVCEHPSVPQHYRDALRSLHRLFILREQIALRNDQIFSLDNSAFIGIVQRIQKELYSTNQIS